MNGATIVRATNAGCEDLRAAVLREVLPVFQSSLSPKLSEADVSEAVNLLFELLAHRIGDPNLDGVGAQVIECFARRFRERDHVKIADRFEPFAKFLLKLVRPARYAALAAKLRNRFTLGDVLKEFALAEESEMKVWSACPWREFPPADLPGKPDFKEQVGWTLRFRNTEDHLAPELDDVREAKLVQSVCVCFIWIVARFRQEIRSALLRSKFSDYLHKVRNDESFAPIAGMCVALSARFCSQEEHRISNPLMPLAEAPSGDEEVEVSMLPESFPVTVIEAEAGGGKTTMLEFLAWQEAGRSLDSPSLHVRVPVYVNLRHLKHCCLTIGSAVKQSLGMGSVAPVEVPWNDLLLLIDGLNEVDAEPRSAFMAEVKDHVRLFPAMRLVLAGRPNSFLGEFKAAIVQLNPLSPAQLRELFRKALPDNATSNALRMKIEQIAVLLELARIPFFAARLASLAHGKNLAALTSRAAIIRYCVHGVLDREKGQASAGVSRTEGETKELLLAHLAFDTKQAGEGEFSRMRARMILGNAKADVSPSLDVSKFLEEARDNHLLERAENDALTFGHDHYHDYFAACKLEADEQSQNGLGVELALNRFAEEHWQECIRLFAGLSGTSRTLAERGAETNPLLAWVLVNDANLVEVGLNQTIALAAYSVFEGDLRKVGRAGLAGDRLFVLAAMGRADLVEQAIIRQRQVLEPSGLRKLSGSDRSAEERKIHEAMLPLGYGLISVLRIATNEQRAGQEGRYCEASRAAVRALKQIKAARTLAAILASWTGKKFDAKSLVPGAILECIIEIGVDEVLDHDIAFLNEALAQWLDQASEADFTPAWPAYGRVLRLASRDAMGVVDDPKTALRWLRKAHEAGNPNGSRELALLLIEEPRLATEAGEGVRLLKTLIETDVESRYELGLRLLKGYDLPVNEAEGFEHLLQAAESRHADARYLVDPMLCGKRVLGPSPHIELPVYAKPFAQRLKSLFPNNPLPLC